MKISYRREIKHNYLIINPEELCWQGYESQMLSRNQIDGILRFQIRQTDESPRFYYEITSKQPLSRILENRYIQTKEIRQLILNIFGTLERMESYLLGEENILLDPEYLYIESDSFRTWLCLIPGLKQSFPEAFGKFLEYLLGCVDHQNKDSVVLAYGLYQETRKENYGLEDILRLLQQNYHDNESDSSGKKDENNTNEYSQNTSNRKTRGKRKDKISNNNRNELSEHPPKTESRQEHSWKSHLSQWKTRIFQQSPKNEPDLPVRASWEMLIQEDEEEILQPNSYPLKKKPSFAKQPSPPPISQGTVLLTDFSNQTEQRVLRALDLDGEDIPISYFPFIIGKQGNLVDFKLNRDTVSRLHLKIDQDGDIYRIKDLNSTNGTFVCGRLLENNEEIELHTGDEVRIARYRYRFE